MGHRDLLHSAKEVPELPSVIHLPQPAPEHPASLCPAVRPLPIPVLPPEMIIPHSYRPTCSWAPYPSLQLDLCHYFVLLLCKTDSGLHLPRVGQALCSLERHHSNQCLRAVKLSRDRGLVPGCQAAATCLAPARGRQPQYSAQWDKC